MQPLTLNNLIKDTGRCTKCDLHKTRIMPVPPEGNPDSRIMVVAQSPGKTENINGKMFTGPSGTLFYRLMTAAKIRRNEIYLTNLIKCMLPGARRPHHEELHLCTASFLEKETALVQPLLYVPLGFHATRYVLKKFKLPLPDKKSMKYFFGLLFRKGNVLIFPLRHPTALLFNPDKETIMQHNYRKLRKIMDIITHVNQYFHG